MVGMGSLNSVQVVALVSFGLVLVAMIMVIVYNTKKRR